MEEPSSSVSNAALVSALVVRNERREHERDGDDEQRVEEEREEERGADDREHERRAHDERAHQVRRALHDQRERQPHRHLRNPITCDPTNCTAVLRSPFSRGTSSLGPDQSVVT